MKHLILKLFPRLYFVKHELWDLYKDVKNSSSHLSSGFFTFASAYVIHGATPQEYICLDFAKLNYGERCKYVTMRRNRRLDSKFNDEESNKILWDKGLFNQHFDMFIKRKYVSVNARTTEEELRCFYNDLKAKRFIIKPNNLYYGHGIYSATTLDELLALRNNGKGYIVEEILENDPEIAVLNNTSLNTLRVITCIDRQGNVHIITIALRTGRKGAIVDNVYGGGTYYHVDIKTGIIDRPGLDGMGNKYIKHPTSGCVMAGFQIKRIDEVKDFAIQLAKRLPNARYVGWDIALTKGGIEVIEGNVCPGACSLQCGDTGKLVEIESYL